MKALFALLQCERFALQEEGWSEKIVYPPFSLSLSVIILNK